MFIYIFRFILNPANKVSFVQNMGCVNSFGATPMKESTSLHSKLCHFLEAALNEVPRSDLEPLTILLIFFECESLRLFQHPSLPQMLVNYFRLFRFLGVKNKRLNKNLTQGTVSEYPY
jgi:hypothetical protein